MRAFRQGKLLRVWRWVFPMLYLTPRVYRQESGHFLKLTYSKEIAPLLQRGPFRILIQKAFIQWFDNPYK